MATTASGRQIRNSGVQYIDIQDVSAINKLLGRYTASSGPIEEVSLGSMLAITSGTLNVTGVVVSAGGTGVTSFTAYSVICGGTVGTAPLQSVASVGTSGQVLTSNGAAVLPTWQDASSGGGGNSKAVRAYNTSGYITVPSGTDTAVQFKNENYDTDSIHDLVTNPTRFTPPTTGRYSIKSQVTFDANSTGYRRLILVINGTTVIGYNTKLPYSGRVTDVQVVGEYQFGDADYVEVWAFQDSGTTLDILDAAGECWFAMHEIANVSNITVTPIAFQVACSDLTTVITTGTTKAYFRLPHAFTLTEVRASLLTAQTSGSLFTVDINMSGTTILSTKLTFDNTETTTKTAATSAVISTTALTDDALITIDVDTVGAGSPTGLLVTLIGTL